MAYLFGIIPIPDPLKAESGAIDLKLRLDWGEPALTIIDARDRNAFKALHIPGAISMPAKEVVGQALSSLELERDIYIYTDANDETAVVASQLRAAGFKNVAELKGGVAAWQAFGYPLDRGVMVAA